jgi:hypothetical protein
MNRDRVMPLLVGGVAMLVLIIGTGTWYYIQNTYYPVSVTKITIPPSPYQPPYQQPQPYVPPPIPQQQPPAQTPNMTGLEESPSDVISTTTIPFTIQSNTSAKIFAVRKVTPTSNGNWQAKLYGNLNGQNMLTSTGGLSPGEDILIVDVQFTNPSQTASVTLRYPELFRLENDGAAIYSNELASSKNDNMYGYSNYLLKLYPLESQNRSLTFKIPASSTNFDFWYGSDPTNFVNGYTIDFASHSIVPFKG